MEKPSLSGDSTWKGVLILWDVDTGEQIKRHTGYTDNLIHRFKIFLDKSRTVPNPNAIESIAFSPDGKILAGGGVYDSQLGRSDSIRLWEVSSGRILTTLAGHTSTVRALRFSPDGKTLASSSSDGTILLWDLE